MLWITVFQTGHNSYSLYIVAVTICTTFAQKLGIRVVLFICIYRQLMAAGGGGDIISGVATGALIMVL